jgi:predicted HicB family RNase H-like nuclease
MSRADEYRYQVQRQRKQELDRQRVRETTRPFLERYRSVLNDVASQGLDDAVPAEFRELSSELWRLESLLESDPFAARDMSRSLGARIHGLPRLAREQRRSSQEAELATAEAFRKARQAEVERQLQLKAELEAVWREGLSGWSTPVALNAAFAELQQLRERLLGNAANNMTSSQISTALREVQQRYEADAERQLQELKNRVQREAVGEVLTLQREQLEEEANKNSGKRAAKLREALAHAIGLVPAEQAEALNQLVREQDEAAVDESQRREVVRAVYQSLQQAGFVVDRPEHLVSEEEDQVLIRARRPAGVQADFRVNLSGHLSYKFHQYKGKTCEKDVAPVMATLQDAYGISLSDKRVIWVNPDDQDQDARPYPDVTQERSK